MAQAVEQLGVEYEHREAGVAPTLPEAPSTTTDYSESGEVGSVVDAEGVHPLPVAPLALSQLGIMARLRGSEQAIATAAATGDARQAWIGFSMHPLVDSPRLGRALLDGYVAAHPSIAELFGGQPG